MYKALETKNELMRFTILNWFCYLWMKTWKGNIRVNRTEIGNEPLDY